MTTSGRLGARASVGLPTKMFEERSEHVYFLAPCHVQTFVQRVGEHLGAEFFHSEGSVRSEPPAHYVMTLYFDSDTRAIAQACTNSDRSVKLRARQYYDQDPELGIRLEPLVWLEVKTHAGDSTRKLRFAIPAEEVQACLRNGVITESMIRFQRRAWGPAAETALEAITELCRQAAGPLRPDCLAHYRRQAWQDADDTVRITLDTELAFHPVPAPLFERGMTGTTLNDVVSEPPVARLPLCLVEIKVRERVPLRASPSWLHELIMDVALEPARDGQQTFSKFLAASRAVHAVPIASRRSMIDQWPTPH